MKSFIDFEAKIVDKGKKKVKNGEKRWVEVEDLNGLKFKVQSGITGRFFDLPLATKVTIKCQKIQDGLPIRPVFMRVYKGI